MQMQMQREMQLQIQVQLPYKTHEMPKVKLSACFAGIILFVCGPFAFASDPCTSLEVNKEAPVGVHIQAGCILGILQFSQLGLQSGLSRFTGIYVVTTTLCMRSQ